MNNQSAIISWVILYFCINIITAQIKVSEEKIVMPTWELGLPEKHPAFPMTFINPKLSKKIYPYPFNINLTQNKIDKEYIGCWLENKYIKVLVTPEIGGKLYGAKDKSNNHNFFYWQPTVKPALVGLTGAWVSGGVEWNYPAAHRHTSLSPVSYRTINNIDGSKTVWVGETEWVYGLRWIVGITIFPNKSVIEAKVKLMNPSTLRNSFYMWATTAQNTNEHTKMIYPTQAMTNHGETRFNYWPIDHEVDLSLWKNTPNARSYFSTDLGGFFGSYDIKKNVGTAIVANENIVIGKKFWTWGTSASGRIWDDILSDGEGPYVEPQAGAYATNQPDFHWIVPEDMKSFSLFFFPVRDIGGYKFANKNGALNIELKKSHVAIGVYSTGELKNANLILTKHGDTIYNKPCQLSPSKPFTTEIPLSQKDNSLYDFKLLLQDDKGVKLLSYAPSKLNVKELPIVKPQEKNPELIADTDELFLIGEKLLRFRQEEKAMRYFQEILKRDKLNSRTNLILAEISIRKNAVNDALEYLNMAKNRDPENGKIYYYYGLCFKNIGKEDQAYDSFYKSVHFNNFVSVSYKEIALLDLKNRNYTLAIKHLKKAIIFSKNPQLLSWLAAAYRNNFQYDLALQYAEESVLIDPLNPMGINEVRLAKIKLEGTNSEDLLRQTLIKDYHYYLNLAEKYTLVGLNKTAIDILDIGLDEVENYQALLYYYLGYNLSETGENQAALKSFQNGENASDDYIFPFRIFTLKVFDRALLMNPDDKKSNYYKGMIYAGLNEKQKAIELFEKSIKINQTDAKSWRNIGLLTSDLSKSLFYYQKAFVYASNDAAILSELYKVMLTNGSAENIRFKLLKDNISLVNQRDDLLSAYLDLLISNKYYDEALSFYTTRTFNNWEGGNHIHAAYVYACMEIAKNSSTPSEAIQYYNMALLYPKNLRVAPLDPDWTGFISYYKAENYKKLGQVKKAKKLWAKVANYNTYKPTLVTYYRALSLIRMGNLKQAEILLEKFKLSGEELAEKKGNQYLVALGFFYQAKYYEAKNNLEKYEYLMGKALKLNSKIASRAINEAKMTYASKDGTY